MAPPSAAASSASVIVKLTTPVPPEEQEALARGLEPDFKFMLDKEGISKEIQAKLTKMDLQTVEAWARVEDSVELVRCVIKEEIGLVPGAAESNRGQMAKLLHIWEVCKSRGTKRTSEEALPNIGDAPKKIPKADHMKTLQAFSDIHDELPEEELPAPRWLEERIAQFEAGQVIAERLSDIVTWAESTNSQEERIAINPDGSVKTTKVSTAKGSMPKTPEQLRDKLKLIGIHWEFVRIRMPGHPSLRDYDLDIWRKHAEWLLGKKVYQREVTSEEGKIVYRPSWSLLLDFEYALRKKMCYFITKAQTPIATALQLAKDDKELWVNDFTTPLALSAGAAAARAEARAEVQRLWKGSAPAIVADRPREGAERSAAEVTAPPAEKIKKKGERTPLPWPKADQDPDKSKDTSKERDVSKQVCWAFQKAKGCPLGTKCLRQHVKKGAGKGKGKQD